MFTYYDLLTIPPTATPQEIKKAFRDQSKLYHPDKAASYVSKTMPKEGAITTALTEIQVKLTAAHEILESEVSRKDYDSFLQDENKVAQKAEQSAEIFAIIKKQASVNPAYFSELYIKSLEEKQNQSLPPPNPYEKQLAEQQSVIEQLKKEMAELKAAAENVLAKKQSDKLSDSPDYGLFNENKPKTVAVSHSVDKIKPDNLIAIYKIFCETTQKFTKIKLVLLDGLAAATLQYNLIKYFHERRFLISRFQINQAIESLPNHFVMDICFSENSAAHLYQLRNHTDETGLSGQLALSELAKCVDIQGIPQYFVTTKLNPHPDQEKIAAAIPPFSGGLFLFNEETEGKLTDVVLRSDSITLYVNFPAKKDWDGMRSIRKEISSKLASNFSHTGLIFEDGCPREAQCVIWSVTTKEKIDAKAILAELNKIFDLSAKDIVIQHPKATVSSSISRYR